MLPTQQRWIQFAMLGVIASVSVCVNFWLLAPSTAAQSPRWVAPIGDPQDPPVVSAFDPPSKPWLAGHRGVDLVAATGSDVRSAGAGTVSYVGSIAGRPVITVSHGELRTTYEPVLAAVPVGARVSTGQLIGTVGIGGHCDTMCVHWGLIRGEQYLDPLLLLRWQTPVLKPLDRRNPSARTHALDEQRATADSSSTSRKTSSERTSATVTDNSATVESNSSASTGGGTDVPYALSFGGAAIVICAGATAIDVRRRRR